MTRGDRRRKQFAQQFAFSKESVRIYERIAAIPEFNINYYSKPCVAVEWQGPEGSETLFAALHARQASLRRSRTSVSSGTRTAKGMKALRFIATSCACFTVFIASVTLDGCGSSSSDHAADDKSLRDLVNRTVAAAMRRDFTEYGKYYAQRRTMVLPGTPITEENGPPKIQLPDGYAIKMVTAKTEFSDAGDLGYALGTYEQTAPDRSGRLQNTVGKWMSVFKKQPDGSWGAVADTYNVDPPP